MTEKATPQPTVVRTSRGLSIASCRLTLYSIMDYLQAGWPPHLIRDEFSLTDRQMRKEQGFAADGGTVGSLDVIGSSVCPRQVRRPLLSCRLMCPDYQVCILVFLPGHVYPPNAGMRKGHKPCHPILALPRSMAQLAPHLSTSDMAAPRDIVADIQHRIERFGQGFGEKP